MKIREEIEIVRWLWVAEHRNTRNRDSERDTCDATFASEESKRDAMRARRRLMWLSEAQWGTFVTCEV
jgi:hypothetical protein